MLSHFDYSAGTQHDGKVGIIDIGSNSIRLVVYDGLRRTPIPVYNEKILCGLGRGLANTGVLNPEGVTMAEAGIRRFLAIARAMDVVELSILATAAVRDAEDGDRFVEKLSRQFKVDVDIVSGKREAKLAAFGVFSSIYKPNGIAGDMGGGSMELVALSEGAITNQITLPLGSLRLMDESGGDSGKMRKFIDRALEEHGWLGRDHGPHFYAIGGSFRTLAKIYMLQADYPVKIIHHYAAEAARLLPVLKKIGGMTPSQLAELPGAGKRAASLIPAALVLEQVLRATKCEEAVFSSTGIREGYLFERLSPYLRNEDPLVSSSADLAAQTGRLSSYARDLYEWMSPLFAKEKETERLARVRLAACILSDIGVRIHPEYRALWVYYRVMESLLFGISHKKRVMLALALFHRHQFKLKENLLGLALASEKERLWARLIGVAANLAYHLSGGVAGNLPRMRLEVKKGEVKLRVDDDAQDILGDAVRKRVDGLGEVFKAFSSKSM